MNKSDLRKAIRITRKMFVNKRFSLDISLPDWLIVAAQPAACVAGYVTNGQEPDVLPWLAILAETGSSLALPHIAARTDPMAFRSWHPGTRLHPAPFGFSQPSAQSPAARPDIILTPLVGFDRSGNRLGQGAGHYDRAFSTFPNALRIGIAWSVQAIDAIPADPWDMPLDAVITESETITMPNSRLTGKMSR